MTARSLSHEHHCRCGKVWSCNRGRECWLDTRRGAFDVCQECIDSVPVAPRLEESSHEFHERRTIAHYYVAEFEFPAQRVGR